MSTNAEAAAEYYARLRPLAQEEYDTYFTEYTPPEYLSGVQALSNVGPWMNAHSVLGYAPPTAARQILIGTLISQLKDVGAWADLDRLWILAAESSGQSSIDLVTGKYLGFPVSPTFTANRGWAGNGTTQWIDTGFNAATAGGKYTLLDACMGVWLDTTGVGCPIGNEDGAYSNLQFSTTNRIVSVNGNAGGPAYTPAATTGFWHGQRTGPTTTQGYGLGGALENTHAAINMSVLSNRNFGICCTNHTAPSKFTVARIAAAWIGRSMNSAEIAGFYSALRQYMTAVGVA